MTARAKPHATGKTKPGDVSERVGVEQIRSRGVNVEQLLEKLIDAAGAEFTTYYYYTLLRMYLAGNEDYKEICEDARLEDRAHKSAACTWSEVCDLTFGKDPRTYDMAARILNEEVEHEAWFIELLSKERDGKVRPSGHFRRGQPGDAPYSKNRGFYNP